MTSDLELLPLLHEVQITLAGSGVPSIYTLERNLLIKALQRFIPWKGYPHELFGEGGIIQVEEDGIHQAWLEYFQATLSL